jgi:NAD(P)-dependent dehydrogenase (short-subunit alcohol dehydrogenase family)
MTPLSAPFHAHLTGHTAIVTGAASPVGAAIAAALASAGAACVVNDVNPAKIEALADRLRESGGQAHAYDGDVANRFQASALIETARDHFGRVSILVNAEAVFKRGEMALLDEWDWRRALDVNVTGAFFCTQLIGRVMADEGGGAIVNVASTAGAHHAIADGIGYATSSAALVGLTRQSAHELAPRGVRVNAMLIPPERTDPTLADHAAALALFLVSDGARGIIGQAIAVG